MNLPGTTESLGLRVRAEFIVATLGQRLRGDHVREAP